MGLGENSDPYSYTYEPAITHRHTHVLDWGFQLSQNPIIVLHSQAIFPLFFVVEKKSLVT